MKNREMFIDLVEEIDQRHLNEHIKKNTDFRSKRIKRYVIATAIYAAACVALFLLIPHIIPRTLVNLPPDPPPSADPVTTDTVTEQTEEEPEVSIDEFFADTKLYKVLKALEIDREDVASLQVGRHHIVNGDVYYLYGNDIYKNTDEHPIMSEHSTMGFFHVSSDYIYYTLLAGTTADTKLKPLFCYNMKTEEKTVVCKDDIYHFDVADGKVLYLTRNAAEEVKAHIYDPETDKNNVVVMEIPSTHNLIGDICYTGKGLAITTDDVYCALLQANLIDMNTKNLRVLYPGDFRGRTAITEAEDGFYVSVQKTELDENNQLTEMDSEYNGVWYTKVSENPVKISDTYYDELYYVNGKLAGVRGDIVEAIDTDPDTMTEFPDSRTQYNDDAHKEIGNKVNEALDELYNKTVESNGGEVPKYLDVDYIATLTARNYESVQRQTTVYDGKCNQVIEKVLTDNLPEKGIMSHTPSWEVANGVVAEGADIKYYVLDQSKVSDDVDREELTLYLEYRYHQDRRSSVDYSQYYDFDVKALEQKYGDLGTVAVYKYGAWEYWNMVTGDQRPIESYPDYKEISALYYGFMTND